MPPLNPPPAAAWYDGTQALPPQSAASERPYDCSGWLGRRVYLESQAWHTPPGANPDTNATIVTLGACLPQRTMIAGQFPVDILLQKARGSGGAGGELWLCS